MSGGDLIGTFTFEYPVASSYVAVSIICEGVSFTPSPIMISQGSREGSYTFPSSYGTPTKITISEFSPSSDSTYKYVAGDPWTPGAKTNITISVSVSGTTMLRYFASEAVTSNINIQTTLQVNYADGTNTGTTVRGTLSSGTYSDGVSFTPPSKPGTYISTVKPVSVLLSPTSDTYHTYTATY